MRRALVIGLGGCGCRVVRMLKERVEWRYGGLGKTPFLQLLGIDTARDAGLDGEDLFVHATVTRGDYRQLIDDVRYRRDRPDLLPPNHNWLDVTVIGDKTEVDEGAGGVRMVGRLAFLFPTNFSRAAQLIRQKIDFLRALTVDDASKAFGQSISLSNTLDIYTIATLCAGTGSSSFIDMGYLLRRLTEHVPMKARTTGILTLPPLNTTDIVKLRNTYGALCELDYFNTDGVTYRAKFPDEPRLLERSDRPYDFVYLVSPDRSERPSLPSHEDLEVAIAEYLFTDIFIEPEARDGRRDDIVAYAFNLTTPDGAPYRYMTFGFSVLQFPAQQAQDACAYRLIRDTLSDWLTDREPSVVDTEELFRTMGLSGEATLRRELLSPEGDPKGQRYEIATVVRNRLDQAARNYRDVSDLDWVKRQLLGGLGEGEGGTDTDIPFGRFRQVIEGNRERLKRDLPNRLLAFLHDRFLIRLEAGVEAALKAVGRLREAVTERTNALRQADPNATVQYAESVLRRWENVLESAERDWMLAFPIPYRGLVRRRLLTRWQVAAEEWMAAKTDAYAMREEIAVLEDLTQNLIAIEQRLRHLRNYVAAMRQAAQDGYQFALQPPRMPGIFLYDEATVQREFERTLPTPDAVSSAKADLLRTGLSELWKAATVPITERHHHWLDNDLEIERRVRMLTDPTTQAQPYQRLRGDRFWQTLKEAATRRFQDITQRGDVIERFMERSPDPARQLQGLLDDATVFLPLQMGESRYQEAFNRDRQIKRWVFWRYGKQEPTTERAREFKTALEGAMRRTVEQEELETLADPFTVLVLTEQGGFPARLIRGITEFVHRIPPTERVKMWSRADLPKWLRLAPPDPRCEELLVAAYAWWLARPVTEGGRRQIVIGEDRLPVSFREAVQRLEDDVDIRRRLERRVQEHLRNCLPDEEKVKQLLEQLHNITQEQLNMLGVEDLKEEQAKGVAMRFINRNEALRRLHEQTGERAPYRFFATDEEAKKAGYPQKGYYCDHCHYYFGDTEGTVPKFCPHCQAV